MKVKKIKEENVDADKYLTNLIEDIDREFIPKLAELLRLANKLTDNNIKILIDKCYSNCNYISALVEQLRLADKLTDDNIRLLVNKCEYSALPKLAKQIKLAGNLTNSNIEVLINELITGDKVENKVDYIMDLAEELPDDYKPTDDIIKLLNRKGYEVLD